MIKLDIVNYVLMMVARNIVTSSFCTLVSVKCVAMKSRLVHEKQRKFALFRHGKLKFSLVFILKCLATLREKSINNNV